MNHLSVHRHVWIFISNINCNSNDTVYEKGISLPAAGFNCWMRWIVNEQGNNIV